MGPREVILGNKLLPKIDIFYLFFLGNITLFWEISCRLLLLGIKPSESRLVVVQKINLKFQIFLIFFSFRLTCPCLLIPLIWTVLPLTMMNLCMVVIKIGDSGEEIFDFCLHFFLFLTDFIIAKFDMKKIRNKIGT